MNSTGEIRTHTSSLLRRLPLPLGYGAEIRSDPGWTRTTDRLLVRELPSPLGHRTVLLLSGSRGTRTHNGCKPAPVFKTGSSSSRMTSVVKYEAAVPQLRELDSNQHFGVQSAASCH